MFHVVSLRRARVETRFWRHLTPSQSRASLAKANRVMFRSRALRRRPCRRERQPMSYKRKKVWIDRFQTILSLRIAAYFILYQVTLWVFASVEHYLFPRMQISMGASIAINYLLLLA